MAKPALPAIDIITSTKALSALAGVVIGGVVFLIGAFFGGFLTTPADPLSKEANAEFLADHAKETGVTTTKSGLQIRVIKAGTGAKPSSPDATVTVHYTGKFVNGKVFDSSVGGDPAQFQLNQVIKGWTEGLQLMHVGEKAELV